jgi:hypothetical protein
MNAKMRRAVEELETMILARFPEATFEVERFPEEHSGIEIWATIDMDEPGIPVAEIVGDRQEKLFLDEGLFILVMAVPTPERKRRLIAEAWERYRQDQREKASA